MQDWSKKVILANTYIVLNSFQVIFIYVSTIYSPQWLSDTGIIIYNYWQGNWDLGVSDVSEATGYTV